MLAVRPEIEDLARALYPTAHVGDPPAEETLFVNGRLCMTDDEVLHFLAASPQEASYLAGGTLFAAKVQAKRVAHAMRFLREGAPERAFEEIRMPAEVNAFLARSAADLIRWSPRQITQDFRYAFQPQTVRGQIDDGARLVQPEGIHVARGARVHAGAVLNAEAGAILIRENAVVEPLAYVSGRGPRSGPSARSAGKSKRRSSRDTPTSSTTASSATPSSANG